MSKPRTTWGLLRYFLYLGSLGKAFVNGVTAAAAGAIAGACFVLGRRAVFDAPTALMALAAFGLLWRFKIPEPILIAGAGVAGLLIFWLRGTP